MKKFFDRIISIALGLVMLFVCIAALGGCTTPKSDSPELLKDYKIIYASGAEYAKESSHAIDLQKQMKKIYGLELTIGTDAVAEGEPIGERKEILIGHTNRPESRSAAERVTRLDSLVTRSGNKIILMAGSTEVLGNCVTYFLENGIGSADGEVTVKNFEEHLEPYEYPHEETAVRIMSLNLRCALSATENNQQIREPRIVSFVESTMPNSIGVQECEHFWYVRLADTIGKLGYVPVQTEIYAGNVPVNPRYAFKNYIWYNSNTTKLIDSGRMWLSETPDQPSQGFGATNYISAGWAILQDRETGAKYVHVNTHLYVGTDKEEIRRKELDLLFEKITSLESQGYQVFLTGDFNSQMNSSIYTQATNKLLDARKIAKETTNLLTFNGYAKEGVELDPGTYRCMDYCFYTKNINVCIEKFDVVEKWNGGYLSDHNALVIDVTLYKR